MDVTPKTCLVTVALLLCLQAAQAGEPRFATWRSMELDNRAAIWLVERFISPGSRVDIAPDGAILNGSNVFGVPGFELSRGGGLSAYEKLAQAYGLNAPGLDRLGHIVNAIEVSSWSSVGDEDADIVERTYRFLQTSLGDVPRDCYMAYFDMLLDVLEENTLADLPIRTAHLVESEPVCRSEASASERLRVHQIPIDEVLRVLAKGGRVVFVDVRERSEFEAGHIPGARNFPLRKIDEDVIADWQDADLVIAYCLKDFRGYEAARRMADLGVATAATMRPYGIVGWRKVGLPVTAPGAVTDDGAARDALLRLARNQPLRAGGAAP